MCACVCVHTCMCVSAHSYEPRLGGGEGGRRELQGEGKTQRQGDTRMALTELSHPGKVLSGIKKPHKTQETYSPL